MDLNAIRRGLIRLLALVACVTAVPDLAALPAIRSRTDRCRRARRAQWLAAGPTVAKPSVTMTLASSRSALREDGPTKRP